jgi:hypothetical protein
LIASLARRSCIAKLAPRDCTRLFKRHTLLPILINQELKMGVYLLLELVGEVAPSSKHAFEL